MTTTPNMALVLPTDHGSADVWDVILGTVFGLIDAHDHTTGKGVKVPSAALRINADVSWSDAGTSRAITDIKALDFSLQASSGMTLLAGALFLSDGTGGLSANELYWRTTSGTNVKVTSGAALNVAAFVGGIGGDYSAIGALVDYDDATDTYRFRQETAASVRQFAKVKFADIQLIEYDAAGDASVPANAITIKSPDALAGAYSLTLPAALPGTTQLLQVSTAGDVTASNTVSQLITAGAGVTASANQHITVSGTGEYKHGDRILAMSALAGSGANWASASPPSAMISSASGTLIVPVPLHVGDRIKSVAIQIFGNGVADLTTDVLSTNASMTETNIGTNTTANQPASWSVITINVTDTTLVANSGIDIRFAANASGMIVGNISVTYDHP